MQVYADNAATTFMSAAAKNAMIACFDNYYGNPSSLHSIGQEAKEMLEDARAKVAKALGCEPREIIFTSGGSEADNQAIISAARLGARKGKKHIISTAFEHHAVLHTLNRLEKEGFEVTLLDGKNSTASKFGAIRYYNDSDITEWSSSLKLIDSYGIRTFWDLQQNQEKHHQEEWQKSMIQLEMRVSQTDEYRQIAFFHHLVFIKE